MKTYKFRISLNSNDVECWREIEITPDKSLSNLAEAIINAFDFEFDHAYGFYDRLGHNYYKSTKKYELFFDMGEDMYEDGTAQGVEETSIESVFTKKGQRMQFIFDYGDMWSFIVKYSGTGEKVPKKRYPCIINSVGEAPEQYPDWD